MTTTITLAAFADRVGRSRQAISELARRGKLTTFGSPPRLHLGLALVEYEKIRPQARTAPTKATAPAPAMPDGVPAYSTSRAAREQYAAERERLALQREARELLPAAEIDAAVAEATTVCRTQLEGLPHRLAPRLAALGADEAQARALLAEGVEDALHGLCARLAGLASEVPA